MACKPDRILQISQEPVRAQSRCVLSAAADWTPRRGSPGASEWTARAQYVTAGHPKPLSTAAARGEAPKITHIRDLDPILI